MALYISDVNGNLNKVAGNFGEDAGKANVDASNLSSANVDSWKTAVLPTWHNYHLTYGTNCPVSVSFDKILAFQFRILGNDSGTFGYHYIAKDAWYSDGAYPIVVACIDAGTGVSQGRATFTIANKTASGFDMQGTRYGITTQTACDFWVLY